MESGIGPMLHRTFHRYKAIEEKNAEHMINLLRLISIIILYANTSVNYYIRKVVSDEVHIGVTVVAGIWLVTVIWTWLMLRSGPTVAQWFKYVSVTFDIVLLTACIFAVKNSGSFLITIYYLIIALSTLRFSAPIAVYSGILSVVTHQILIHVLPHAKRTPNLTDSVIISLTMLILSLITAVTTWRGRLLVFNVSKAYLDYTRAKDTLARYVSHHIAEEILTMDDPDIFHGNRMQITVLVADIRGFTQIAEQLDAEMVVKILNIWFSEMIEIVFRNGGTLEKVQGDAMVVLFGAPLTNQKHGKTAVVTAMEMQNAMVKINNKLTQAGLPSIKVGIGIHSGPVVVGNIGTQKRMEYAAIGETITMAHELEVLSKGGEIIVSESVIDQLDGNIQTQELSVHSPVIHGKSVRIYRITGIVYSKDHAFG